MNSIFSEKEEFLLSHLLKFIKESTPESVQFIEHDISFNIIGIISKLSNIILESKSRAFEDILVVVSKQSEMIKIRKYLHLLKRMSKGT
jgi:hypothetical protein